MFYNEFCACFKNIFFYIELCAFLYTKHDFSKALCFTTNYALIFKNLSFYNELYTARQGAILKPFWHREGSMAELSRTEPSRTEPSRAGPSPSRAEPSRAEPGRAEPSRAEPSRADPGRAGPSRAESMRDRSMPGKSIFWPTGPLGLHYRFFNHNKKYIPIYTHIGLPKDHQLTVPIGVCGNERFCAIFLGTFRCCKVYGPAAPARLATPMH